ncbi:hypothetical protein [Erysipelothrix anatis]|uniref:hypothetical protein n=1 Tax=Erysipelothrix anatis TaxID=2683713 RepID=UPI001357C43E|nr:hypothetical protein [Erysipelothrix anatis]
MKSYNKEITDEIIRLHFKEERKIISLTQEYHLGSGTLQYWLRELRKECHSSTYIEEITLSLEESKQLILEIRELKKENEFLKKAATFFAKEIN